MILDKKIFNWLKIILYLLMTSVFIFNFKKGPTSSYRADRKIKSQAFIEEIKQIFPENQIISLTKSAKVSQAWYVSLRYYPALEMDINKLYEQGFETMSEDEACRGDESLWQLKEKDRVLFFWLYPSEKCFLFQKAKLDQGEGIGKATNN